VVTTKYVPEVLLTSKLLGPLLSSSYCFPQPTYVLIQNGLGVEKDLYEKVIQRGDPSPARIITCVINIFTNLVEDTVTHGALTRIIGGVYQPEGASSTTEADDLAVKELIDLAVEGGCEGFVSPNIQAAKYKKNQWNACIAAVTCLTRTPVGAFFSDDSIKQKLAPFLAAFSHEIAAVGGALCYDPKDLANPNHFVDESEASWRNSPPTHKPSMLIDVESGKPFELECILGEVVRHGRRLGVPIPRLEAVYAMLSVVQHQHIASYAYIKEGLRFP